MDFLSIITNIFNNYGIKSFFVVLITIVLVNLIKIPIKNKANQFAQKHNCEKSIITCYITYIAVFITFLVNFFFELVSAEFNISTIDWTTYAYTSITYCAIAMATFEAIKKQIQAYSAKTLKNNTPLPTEVSVQNLDSLKILEHQNTTSLQNPNQLNISNQESDLNIKTDLAYQPILELQKNILNKEKPFLHNLNQEKVLATNLSVTEHQEVLKPQETTLQQQELENQAKDMIFKNIVAMQSPKLLEENLNLKQISNATENLTNMIKNFYNPKANNNEKENAAKMEDQTKNLPHFKNPETKQIQPKNNIL